MKKYLIPLAAALLASCTSDSFTGASDTKEVTEQKPTAIIIDGYGSNAQSATRATAQDAADLLGGSFRVYAVNDGGVVFNNYQVCWTGTPGSTSTNTAGWEYQGYMSKTTPAAVQGIKFWDESSLRYDFVAFSGLADSQIIQSVESNTFAVDTTTMQHFYMANRVSAANTRRKAVTGVSPEFFPYKEAMKFDFRRMASRMRIGFYETVSGYAVKDLRFYYADNAEAHGGTSTKTAVGLDGQFPASGDYTIYYDVDNVAHTTLNAGGKTVTSRTFGSLKYVDAATNVPSLPYLKADGTAALTGDNVFLGASSAKTTFAFSSETIDGQNNVEENSTDAIVFASASNANATRATISGSSAAELLGKNFVVEGTKGSEGTNTPTTEVAFDNYLVAYTANSAGTTESNTNNWEYVGITKSDHAAEGVIANNTTTGIGRTAASQTIKYWDYTQAQYDFIAYSTGTCNMVSGATAASDGNVKVTKIATGTGLATSAFSFTGTRVEDLKNCYFTDVTPVAKANYGKVVNLTFKNLTAKVRVALYETVPGYSVSKVEFYQEDYDASKAATWINADQSGHTSATLFTTGSDVIPASGTITVYYPHTGTSNSTEADHNKASVTTTPGSTTVTTQAYGTLNYTTAEANETAGSIYLGRTLPAATFAGSSAANYYSYAMPSSTGHPLTLRVNYTLTSTDGANEQIHVYGAKAVVPATYTKWEPNYAYTYVFKINDGTNGWTSQVVNADGVPTDEAGLFPITFDAVVTEATDVNAEQTTVTTVATPSITTYQQGHSYTTDEYSKSNGNIYVQVMDNSSIPAKLVSSLSATNSLLYKLDNDKATEALVEDALANRTTDIAATDVTGRNALTLTKVTSGVSSTVTSIVNGVTDDPISVGAGQATEITASGLSAGTYAYVYDYTSGTKTVTAQYQPIAVTVGSAVGGIYYPVVTSAISTTAEADGTVASADYIYFAKTTNGTGTTTYSYVTTKAGETSVAGLYKVAKTTVAGATQTNALTVAQAGTFYFDVYNENNGKYAVKVIKVVD